MKRVHVALPDAELERFDGECARRGLRRSAALRLLIAGGLPEQESADLREALVLLSESARAGSVPARLALVRTLTVKPVDPLQVRRDELMARRRARGKSA